MSEASDEAPRNPRMRIPLRPEVGALPRYAPGRSAPGAVKLSSNESPEPPSQAVIDAAARALVDANRYPDFGATALTAALAGHLGVGEDQVVVGDGSSAVLLAALSVVCRPGAEVVHAWRSFESYPIAAPSVGARSVPVPLTLEGRHDLDALAAAVGPETAAVILCTPNNPTGPALTLAQVRDFVERVPQEVLVLVDEAYIELATEPGVSTAVALIGQFPNVLVLRTFSKVYALAGLRVGYGIGHPDLVGAIRAVSVPFGVSSVAQAAALAALSDRDTTRERIARTVAERERVRAELLELGYEVPVSQSNFVWIPASQSEPGLVAECARAGIIVRPFPEGVRVSIGTRGQDDRFLEVARAHVAKM